MTTASYGSYTHDDAEVAVSLRVTRNMDNYGRVRTSKFRYLLTGVKIGTSQADLTSKLASLESAYEVQGQDFVFLDNNGAETVHVLRSGDTVGGTRTSGIEYLEGYPGLWGSGTEYVVSRTYRVSIEGDKRTSGGLLHWEEHYTYVGDGGSEYRWVESLLGDPQRQRLKLRTTGIGIQTGFAVGEDTYPPVPPALFPELLMRIKGQSPRIRVYTPQFYHTGEWRQYKVAWTYIMEGATGIPGTPTPSP